MVATFLAEPVQESFTSYVAHELRTPLATQRALLELALADPRTDVSAWREIGADVLRACRRQERLLQACLTLARSQGETPRCEPIDLAVIAAAALRAHDASGLEHIVALEPAWTSGDPDLVERLVANLVANAVVHNTVGGWIEVETRTDPGQAVLSVTNSGPVVPPDDLPYLFQPFRRLDGAGLGLGLTIVQTVADTHDAAITVRALCGGGLAVAVAFASLD